MPETKEMRDAFDYLMGKAQWSGYTPVTVKTGTFKGQHREVANTKVDEEFWAWYNADKRVSGQLLKNYNLSLSKGPSSWELAHWRGHGSKESAPGNARNVTELPAAIAARVKPPAGSKAGKGGKGKKGVQTSIPEEPIVNPREIRDFGYDKERIKESYAIGGSKEKYKTRMPSPKGLDYLPFQKKAIDMAVKEKSVLIADPMGVGKTIQALGVVNSTRDSKRVLVVSPASLKQNWAEEAEKWLTDDRPVRVVNSSTGWKSVPKDGKVLVITNYEAFQDVSKIRNDLRNEKWDTVILDEAHRVKNRTAQQTVGIFGNEDGVRPVQATRKIAMTGTPIDKDPTEVYTIARWLDPGRWGTTSNARLAFEDRYAIKNQYNNVVGAKNVEELQAKLRGTIMIRRSKDEVLPDLPDKARRVITLQADTKEERKALSDELEVSGQYDSLANLGDRDDGWDLVSVEPGRRNFSQSKGDDEKKKEPDNKEMLGRIARLRHNTAMAKLRKVVDHVGEASLESPVVVFAHHQETVDGLMDGLEAKGFKVSRVDGTVKPEQRLQEVKNFQEGKTDIAVLSFDTGTEGLTLTRADRAIFAELDWRPKMMQQAEGRIERIGQKNNILIEHVVLEGSLDENMAYRLNDKLNTVKGIIGVDDRAMVTKPIVTDEEGMEVIDWSPDTSRLRAGSPGAQQARQEKYAKTPARQVSVKDDAPTGKTADYRTGNKPAQRGGKAAEPGARRGRKRTGGKAGAKDAKDKGRKVNITMSR